MLRILNFLGRHAFLFMAGGVFVGLAFPALATAAKPLFAPLILAMLTVSMLRIEPVAIARQITRPVRLVLAIIWILLLAPCLTFIVVRSIGLDETLSTALVMWSASPPLVSAPSIVLIMGLEGAAALAVMVGATFAFPFTVPWIALGLLDIEVEIGAFELMLRLLAMVGGAALLSQILRRVFGKARINAAHAPLDGFMVILMVFFAIAIMDGLTAAMIENPVRIGWYVVAAFSMALAMQCVAAPIFGYRDRMSGAAISVASGNRNMALILAASASAFAPETFIYLAVLQFPIYLLPAVTGPIYRKWVLPLTSTKSHPEG